MWPSLIALGVTFGLAVATVYWILEGRNGDPKSDNPRSTATGNPIPLLEIPSQGDSETPSELPAHLETVWPLAGGRIRVTKKPFGIYIDPNTSPVQPERFRGYHTGADFEIFPEENPTKLAVHAVCTGELKVVRWVSGYGGVVVQRCTYRGNPVTVVYGHLALDSIVSRSGQRLLREDSIGTLGKNKSRDTDGERAHLHLAFHQGEDIDMHGYVARPDELTAWLDPLTVIEDRGGLE